MFSSISGYPDSNLPLCVDPIPSFHDNYTWAIHDGQSVLLVDPGQAEPVVAWLAQHDMRPTAILITHRHADHLGGVEELRTCYDIPVHGPAEARPVVRQIAREGGELVFSTPAVRLRVMETPGHTEGHLAYLGHGWLFCGDTLFSCGCGKVAGGTLSQLHASLERIGALPEDILVFPAHEYTLENLAFARYVDPDNPALVAWQAQAGTLRRQARPTLPVRLGDELARNPFLRSRHAASWSCPELPSPWPPATPERAFQWLRAFKDRFHV